MTEYSWFDNHIGFPIANAANWLVEDIPGWASKSALVEYALTESRKDLDEAVSKESIERNIVLPVANYANSLIEDKPDAMRFAVAWQNFWDESLKESNKISNSVGVVAFNYVVKPTAQLPFAVLAIFVSLFNCIQRYDDFGGMSVDGEWPPNSDDAFGYSDGQMNLEIDGLDSNQAQDVHVNDIPVKDKITFLYSDFSTGDCSNPFEIVSADFDDDGNVDVAITCSSWEQDKSVFEGFLIFVGDGDGILKKTTSIEILGGVQRMIGADFNNDGYTDLAVIKQIDQTVEVFLSNQNGAFYKVVEIKNPSDEDDHPSGMVTSDDFNGDGNLDLVVRVCHTSITNCNAFIYLGDGTGEFKKEGDPILTDGLYGFTPIDFDCDLDIDLVAPVHKSSYQGIVALKNNGNGHFAESINKPFSSNGLMFKASDFDDDGHTDLIIPNYTGFSILWGNCDNPLNTMQDWSGLSASIGYYEVGNFNGDNYSDIAFVTVDSEQKSKIVIASGNNAGNFITLYDQPLGGGQDFGPLSAGDFNNDGYADLAMTVASKSILRIYLSK